MKHPPEQICPQCGRKEPDLSSAFCDHDGTRLVPAPTQAPVAAGKRRAGLPVLPLALAGCVLLLIVGILAWPELSPWLRGPLNTLVEDVQLSISDGPPSTVQAALKRCYGTPPALPKLSGSRAEDGFEQVKRVTRLGKELMIGAATPPLTDKQEREVGAKVAKQLEGSLKLSTDPSLQRRLDRLLTRLLPVAPRQQKMPYKFKVVHNKEVNALMLPGGRGYVFSGLMERLRDDNQLAFVIAHELAHGELKHSADALRVSIAGKKIGTHLGEGGEQAGEWIGLLANRLVELTYDQDREFEADRLGLCFATLAAFEASGGQGSFERMGSLQGDKGRPAPPSDAKQRILYNIISTHPPIDERKQYQRLLRGRLK